MRDYEKYYHKSFEQVRADVILALTDKYGPATEKVFNEAAYGRHKNLSVARIEKDCGIAISDADLTMLRAIQEAEDYNLKAKALMERALKYLDGVY